MKKYNNYKESGLIWLGKIPNHWEVKKLKQVAESVQTGFTPSTDEPKFYEEGSVDWFAPSDFGDHVILKNAKKKITPFAIESGNARYFQPKSVLLIGIGATLGKVGLCETGCSSNQQINAISFKSNYDPYFATYYLKSINQIISSSANASTLPILNQTGTKDIFCVCPPLPEQRAIAAYLDHKTAQLDTLLTQKEALLKLLHKKREAIINEAVTQGLDPAAPRKPSGVAWLGDVPAHWEVKRLKQLTIKIGSGVTPLGGANVYEDSGIPLFRSQNIYPDGLRLDDVAFITEEVHQSMKNSQVENGDVLLNITGASIGRCYFYKGVSKQANVNQHVCIIRPNEQAVTEYLQLALSSTIGQHQIDMSQNGASREGLTFSQLKEFYIPCPSIKEQEEIVRIINLRLQKISGAATAIHTQIQALKDYRQSLISEVVTGKVDVRAAEPVAPEADLPLWRHLV